MNCFHLIWYCLRFAGLLATRRPRHHVAVLWSAHTTGLVCQAHWQEICQPEFLALKISEDVFVICDETPFLNQQVYNEQIRDLLANSPALAVREDGTKGVVVQGLTLHQVCERLRERERTLNHHAFPCSLLRGSVLSI